MKLRCLTILLSTLAPLTAQTVFNLEFSGDGARDLAAERELELHNVVVMEAGEVAYGDFDGKGAVIVQSDPELKFASLDPIWIELWVNPMAIGKTGTLLTKGTGGNYRLAAAADGTFAFIYYSQGKWRSLVSTEELALHEWQHLGAWFDSSSGEILLFLNGRLVGKGDEFPAFQSTDDQPLLVGGSAVSTGDGYVGISGGIGPVLIARGNPREVSSEAELGAQVFEVESPF